MHFLRKEYRWGKKSSPKRSGERKESFFHIPFTFLPPKECAYLGQRCRMPVVWKDRNIFSGLPWFRLVNWSFEFFSKKKTLPLRFCVGMRNNNVNVYSTQVSTCAHYIFIFPVDIKEETFLALFSVLILVLKYQQPSTWVCLLFQWKWKLAWSYSKRSS